LEDALKWSEAAVSMPFIGQANFDTLSVKSQVLSKMGRDEEAKKTMQAALHDPTATPIKIHGYGRQLQAAKKTDEAIAVFKYNAERFGDVWPVHVGLARAYAANGDIKQALEHAQKALPQAPDPLNRQNLEAMIKTFSEGQNIAQ
jgi:tetratricopeptide (TPR) repeat protein